MSVLEWVGAASLLAIVCFFVYVTVVSIERSKRQALSRELPKYQGGSQASPFRMEEDRDDRVLDEAQVITREDIERAR